MRTTISHTALMAALAYGTANEGRGGAPGASDVEVSMGGSSSGSFHMDNEDASASVKTGEGNGSVEVGTKQDALDADEQVQIGDDKVDRNGDQQDDADDKDKQEDAGDGDDAELPEFKPGEDGTVDPEVVKAYDKVYKTEGGKLDLSAFSAEWWGNAQASEDGSGHLDDGAYAYLDHLGVPKDMVRQIEAGQVALNNQRDGVLYQRAGGKPNFDAAFEWATKGGGYDENQRAAFNRAIDGDDASRADAVDLLMTRFDKANTSGVNPRKSSADEAGAGAGEGGKGGNGQVFRSKQEWLDARAKAGKDIQAQAEVSRIFRRSPGAKNW